MNEFCIYGVDQTSKVPTDCCLLKHSSNDDGNTRKSCLLISRTAKPSIQQHENLLICCNQIHDDSIDDNDLIVPSYVTDILNIENSTKVYAIPVFLSILNSANISRVILIYEKCRSYRHWDEYATNTNFSLPCSWSIEWPINISQKALVRMLPILLDSRRLIHGTVLVFDALDITMVRSTAIY